MVDFKSLKKIYDQNGNVMEYCRSIHHEGMNTASSIEVSYDLQAGSYITPPLQGKELENFLEYWTTYTQKLATLFDSFGGQSILEAGVGEATTLTPTMKKMKHVPKTIMGFDLSWSRVKLGKQYSEDQGLSKVELFLGDLLEVPISDSAIEIVYTFHSIEPNRGMEKPILEELYRISSKYVVLIEPSNELGNEQTKERIAKHQYCQDLYKTARELHYKVIEYSLFGFYDKPSNQSALLIIEVDPKNKKSHPEYACPICKNPLAVHKEHYFCKTDGLIFPVIAGIPCLRRLHGILGSKFLELA